MQHDEQWLDDRCESLEPSYPYCQGCVSSSAVLYAIREYHEHMMRWRPVDDLPDKGDVIEIACMISRQNSDDETRRGIFTFNGKFESNYFAPAFGYEYGVFETVVGWRLAGPPPK